MAVSDRPRVKKVADCDSCPFLTFTNQCSAYKRRFTNLPAIGARPAPDWCPLRDRPTLVRLV